MAIARRVAGFALLSLLVFSLATLAAARPTRPTRRDGQIPISLDFPVDTDEPVRFDGQKLVRVTVPSGVRPSWFGEPAAQVDGAVVRDGLMALLQVGLRLDVWGVHKLDGDAGWAIDLRATDEQLVLLRDALEAGRNAGVWVEVVHENIQAAIDGESVRIFGEEFSEMKKRPKKPPVHPPPPTEPPKDPSEWFAEYHPYEELLSFYNKLASDHPHVVSVVPSIGKTYEGRDLVAVHISAVPPEARGPNFKQVWWQGLIHAREWISGATVQYITHKLVSAYADPANPDHEWATKALNETEFVIVPTVNPDGYEYSWKKNRLWRKNRRPIMGTVGVDLNRNYPDGWGTGGGSDDPYSEAYEGPSPLSEPEAQVLTTYFKSLPNVRLAIDFHSYSQLVLRPLGYSYSPAPHEAQLKAAGDIVRDAIYAQSGKRYVSEREIDLYQASGTAEDWFYSEGEGKRRAYGFTIELRPSASEGGWGGDGFILHPKFIVPVGEEIWSAMKPLVDYVGENPLKADDE